MEGNTSDGCLMSASSSKNVQTLLLVGRTGNGKSATGNSILGKKSFKSMRRPTNATSPCEIDRSTLEDEQTVKVIDTSGWFDFSSEVEITRKNISKCFDMAEDGIDAILVVLSVRNSFTKEEEAVLERLLKFFGNKLSDYMIVIFTGGDDLEDNDQTLDDYLGNDCPEPLKNLLEMCGNRCVLFDNKTKDEGKKFNQLKNLLNFVNVVVDKNKGIPYTNDLFLEGQKEPLLHLKSDQTYFLINNRRSIQEVQEEPFELLKNDQTDTVHNDRGRQPTNEVFLGMQKEPSRLNYNQADKISNTEQEMSDAVYLIPIEQKINKMMEAKQKEMVSMIEQQIKQEQNARLEVEERTLKAEIESNDKIRRLKEELENVKKNQGGFPGKKTLQNIVRAVDQALSQDR